MELEVGKIYYVSNSRIKGVLDGFSKSNMNAFLSFCDNEGNKTGGGIVITVRKLKKLNT